MPTYIGELVDRLVLQREHRREMGRGGECAKREDVPSRHIGNSSPSRCNGPVPEYGGGIAARPLTGFHFGVYISIVQVRLMACRLGYDSDVTRISLAIVT